MAFPTFTVKVPATTANLGPGFDSVGLALDLFMSVEVTAASTWQVIYEDEEFQELATDEQNLIVQTIQEIARRYDKEVHPARLHVTSEIPLGKGFGSSASAIAAGIVIADHLLHLTLTDHEKVLLGTELEGHADNISAALLGGVVISYFDGEQIDFVQAKQVAAHFIALVPPEMLKTTEARGLLPKELSHEAAVKGSSASAVLGAALVQNDWDAIGKMMEKDQLHEAYRKELFPHFDDIRNLCKKLGAYGMTISGAGPTLIVAVQEGTEENIVHQLQASYPYYNYIKVASSQKGAYTVI